MPFKSVLVKGLGNIKFPSEMSEQAIKQSLDSLDMSQAARMAREKEQGFISGYYHGSQSPDIESFKVGGQGVDGAHGNLFGDGVYATKDPYIASSYAQDGTVYPLSVRGKMFDATSQNPINKEEAEKINKVINEFLTEGDRARIAGDAGVKRKKIEFKTEAEAEDFYETQRKNWEYFDGFSRTEPEFGEGFSVEYTDFNAPVDVTGLSQKDLADAVQRSGGGSITDIFKSSGYDGVEYTNQTVIFDPKNIRSTNAAFDPAKKESSNLLASTAPLAAGSALAALNSPDASADTGTIEGPKSPNILKVSNFIDQNDDIIFDDMLGGVTSYMNKLAYDDKIKFKDRLLAALDLL